MSVSACPACDVAPLAGALGSRRDPVSSGPSDAAVQLSLPDIHCAVCIATVERALNGYPGVRRARVNLTLKRVWVDVAPDAVSDVTADILIERLADNAIRAFELDSGALTQSDPQGRDLLMRLGVAGFAMMNVMLLSVAVWSGATDATRDLFHWISACIAIPTIAFSAQPFFRHALAALGKGRLNMDVPISLAILLAAGMSIYETAASGQHAYFDAALSLTFFLLGGRYLDHRTRSTARSAAAELAALEVPRATVVRDGRDVATPIADIRPGDIVRVVPGARVPVDGIVETGTSELDRALLTGESLPAAVRPGDALSAGEVNLTGPLTLTVTAAGKDSRLHRLAELVALSETARNRYTSLADRAAAIYAPAVHLLALFAFIGWVAYNGDIRHALNVAVAVLIITCPCALGLAVPAVVTAASGRLFRKGLLIKTPTALERLAEVDTVVFDKTGTLTTGVPVAGDLDATDPRDLGVVLALARASAHPLAVALTHALESRGVRAAPLDGIRERPGFGVESTWKGQPVRLGRAAWVEAMPLPGAATYLRIGEDIRAFPFTDQLRDGAAEAVAGLRAMGKTAILLSGDNAAAVADVATRTGIDDFHANLLPEDKAARISTLSDQGHKVLMVGDGLNDTAALAAAHASISPASALDAARTVSDIVLTRNSLADVPTAVNTAKMATRRIRENFAIAAAYNAVAIPIALMGYATPLMAALAMSLSSITVSLNALRVR